MEQLILVVNPVTQSTQIAVYNYRKQVFLTNIKHPANMLSSFKKIAEQRNFREKAILEELKKSGINFHDIKIVVGRGGLLKPMSGGVYNVNEAMIADIKHPMGEHESNLGGLMAYDIAKKIGRKIPAIIIDPASVDEMDEVAKISGMPEIHRKSILHTLNQRTIARNFVREIGHKYEEVNLIVAHLGKSISVGAHRKGRIVDVNNGLIGDGPMTTERSGTVPCGDLVDLCFSGKFSKEQILKKMKGEGGVYAYIGTGNSFEIEKRIEKCDKKAELVFSAVSYQIAKEIGALSTVLNGEVDGILITGELAYSKFIINELTSRIKHLGLIRIYPGEDDMDAYAMYGYLVLAGEIETKEYK
ncbi:MAG: butyrate kinase [Bacteroidota bacterium]